MMCVCVCICRAYVVCECTPLGWKVSVFFYLFGAVLETLENCLETSAVNPRPMPQDSFMCHKRMQTCEAKPAII